jgi:hypothetical protein
MGYEITKNYILKTKPEDNESFFEINFKKTCFKYNFIIPKNLDINHYDILKNDLERVMKNNRDEINKLSRNFAKDNEHEIKTEILSIFGSSPPSISQFTTATMEIIGDKIKKTNIKQIKNQKTKKNEFNPSFFLYWKPQNAETVHINEFFWFFIRINAVLHLMKQTKGNSIILYRYLLQIYNYSIPYILKIEQFYYNKPKIHKIMEAYVNNFELKYEFSFKNMRIMKNQPNTFYIKSIKPPNIILTEFDKVYSGKKKFCLEVFNLINKFKYFEKYKFNEEYRLVYSTFYLLYNYINIKEDFNFENIYTLIPFLNYLLENDLPSDEYLNKDFINLMKYYPRKKKKLNFLDSDSLIILLLGKITPLSFKEEDCSEKYLNELILEILDHVSPQHAKIRSFEKKLKLYYFKNFYFALFIDNLIVNSVCGLYKKWSNIVTKIFKRDYLSTINTLLKFYTDFVIHIRNKNKIKVRFRYINKNFLKTKFIKYILQEFLINSIFKNINQVKKHIVWEVLNKGEVTINKTNSSGKLNLTLDNFLYCCIKNGNRFRKKFYFPDINISFLDTRRKNKSICIIRKIQKKFILLKQEEFFIQTIFKNELPEKFDYVFSKEEMNINFGDFWKKEILKFWTFYNLDILLDKKNYGWDLYLKKIFKMNDKDLFLIRGIFIRDIKIKHFINDLTKRGKSLLFYLVEIYEKRFNFLRVFPLTLKETLYQLLSEKFNKHKFLDFGISYCCSKIHNSVENNGYEKISITKNGLFCFHKKNKYKKINEKEKYNYFRKKSSGLIKDFVKNHLFEGFDYEYNYYKKVLYIENKKNKKIEDVKMVENSKKFFNLLSKEQINNFNISSIKTKEEEEEEEEEGEKNYLKKNKKYFWPLYKNESNKKEKCRKKFLANLTKSNKIVCFFRKMCKWVTDWENRLNDDRKICFYPAIGYIYSIKKRIGDNFIYILYKLCLCCKKMKKYNEDILSIYEYKCKDCQILKDEKEDYKKTILIDTSEEYNVFTRVTM